MFNLSKNTSTVKNLHLKLIHFYGDRRRFLTMIQKEGKLAGTRAMRAKGDDLFELKVMGNCDF